MNGSRRVESHCVETSALKLPRVIAHVVETRMIHGVGPKEGGFGGVNGSKLKFCFSGFRACLKLLKIRDRHGREKAHDRDNHHQLYEGKTVVGSQ